MGLLSKLKTISDAVGDINQVAEDVSKGTVEDYGEPVYSLYTALQLGELHRRIDVTDDQGNLKYYTKSSIIAIKGKTEIMDADGNIIANLEKRPISLHEKHFVTMADGRNFTLSNEILHVIRDVTNIEGLGWQLRGNIIGLTFNLVDENNQPVATVGKRMVSIHESSWKKCWKPGSKAGINIVPFIIIRDLEK